ncbi:methyltransferase N6AMT1-like isoform X2 [Littorina saxatilis]|uniref:methyltransferase N6AMT1-like isoform X2 n=1 Tax=Littorina saxatilis TaxID=31220 RepID=UPI0038B4BE52
MNMAGDKSLFSTPTVRHATSRDYDDVYEPAEDSFLMLDALEQELDVLRSMKCTDINPKAADFARRTGRENNVLIHPVLCDLCGAVEYRLQGQVDVLLFNPPYVVTPSSEVSSGGIEASWAGGVKGREVTDRLLPRVGRLLSPRGVFYLIVLRENVVEEIETAMKHQGFTMTTVITRKAGREHLSVVKFHRVR